MVLFLLLCSLTLTLQVFASKQPLSLHFQNNHFWVLRFKLLTLRVIYGWWGQNLKKINSFVMLFTRSLGAKTLKKLNSFVMLFTRSLGAKTLKTNIPSFTMLFTCSHGAKTLKQIFLLSRCCSHVLMFFPSSSPHQTISWFGCSKWRNSTTSR